MQTILSPQGEYQELGQYLEQFQHIFLVCGNSFQKLSVGKYLGVLEEQTKVNIVRFSDFSPNPNVEDAEAGTTLFQLKSYDLIVAAGGGSAIDTAKYIRLNAGKDIPLLAIPTTAGSGSEATHFAVVYRQNVKESLNCGLPDAVLLDPSTLTSLPDYQRKATMLDALCHGVESLWSVNATDESRTYARRAICQIMGSYEDYLKNEPAGNAGMMQAAHLAGKAINISKTTAGHAMCYQITKLYGLAHGHAAALCVAKLWPYLLERPESALAAEAMGCDCSQEGMERFRYILGRMELDTPICTDPELERLTNSVNADRLKNFPVSLTPEEIKKLYQEILSPQQH